MRDWKTWFKAASIRALKTGAEVAGSMIVIGAFNATAWDLLIQTTITSVIASYLFSIKGLPEVEE